MREIVTAKELKFYRVHIDVKNPTGRFLAREKEIGPLLNNPEALKTHLGLSYVPKYITEVNVPKNTKLIIGRIGSQPAFGLMQESGFQYQLMSKIPESSFVNTKLIIGENIVNKMNVRTSIFHETGKVKSWQLEVTHDRILGKNKFNKLKNSIKQNGIQETIKYVEYEGRFHIVDGNHRVMAARELGVNNIPVEKVELPYASYKNIKDLVYYGPKNLF